jgi:hypothetical protein
VGDFADKPLEGEFRQEQLHRLLVAMNFTERGDYKAVSNT